MKRAIGLVLRFLFGNRGWEYFIMHPRPELAIDEVADEGPKAVARPDAKYVFLSTTGTPIEPMNLRNHFKKVIAEMGLSANTRFHDLRHSVASFLIDAGEHPRVIQEMLGHSLLSTTMNVYGHVLESTHRQATDRLDELFTPDAAPKDEGDQQEI
ncbi:MAG: tyrosine-type recombinase/integrase [Roseiflexaceae bacterium]